MPTATPEATSTLGDGAPNEKETMDTTAASEVENSQGDMSHSYPVSETCLYKSFTYGNYTGDWTEFDQLEDIKSTVTSDMSAHSLTSCVDVDGYLTSLTMTFTKADDSQTVTLPRKNDALSIRLLCECVCVRACVT